MYTVLPILRVLGVIVMVFATTMTVPLGVAWWMSDAARSAYPPAMVLTFVCGLLMWLAARRDRRELQRRDGVLLVSFAWTGLPLFASLPLLFYFNGSGAPLSFTDAYFESMSGLTTTGATVLTGLDELPPSINLWRCFLQWLGGMGILVLAVAILPLLGVGGSQLFRAETSGPMKDTKLTPRITETAKGLWTVYLAVSLACVLAYWAAGMSLLDAWTHMFSTMSLGGLSSHDASFGHFDSPTIEWVAIPFMLFSSCNYALYFAAVTKRDPRRMFGDVEYRATMGVLLLASLGVAALLVAKGTYPEPMVALRMALFNVVSIASTTGYSSADYTQWPVFAPMLMLLLSGVATSAGSTGAGIKMVRIVILVKQARRELARIVHPKIVNPVSMGGEAVATSTIFAVLGFMMIYGATIVVLTMTLLLTDMTFDTAFGAVVAAVNNLGPGLNELGPAGSFKDLTDVQKWIYVIGMLLGRLEMLSFLVLLTPAFWRK